LIHRITVESSGKIFDADADRPVLNSAHRANVLIAYSCRGGRCGTCRGRVLSGEVEYPDGLPEALTEEEAARGYALFCSAYPRSDLTIEPGRRKIDAD
jgi:CDP-4-dehydro-6-deoxyglucose reductase, E3